jgi:hypothetical protein
MYRTDGFTVKSFYLLAKMKYSMYQNVTRMSRMDRQVSVISVLVSVHIQSGKSVRPEVRSQKKLTDKRHRNTDPIGGNKH